MDRLALVERWWLRLGAFLLPLAMWWDTYDQYVLPKVLVARVLIFGLLILGLVRVLITRQLEIKRTPLDLPLLAFLGSAALSTVFAQNANVAVFGIYSRYDGLVTIVTYALLFWLSAQAIRGPDDARALLRALLVSGYLVAFIAIVQSVNDSLRQGGSLAPAFGTLGQRNVLGAFLAMLLPLAYWELVRARTWSGRVLALNLLAVMGLALLLTLSRTAWFGAALAGVVLLAGTRTTTARLRLLAVMIFLAAGVFLAALGPAGILSANHSVAERVTSLLDPKSWVLREAVWRDSVQLIASRPLVGYGPDNFGLVYPRFEAGFVDVLQVDKAHADTLQVAATQGLIGLAAYLFLLGAFIRAFWRHRHSAGAVPLFAAWVAYQVTVQLNFSALAAALPFWVFAAAALHIFGALEARPISAVAGRAFTPAAWLLIALLAVVGAASTVSPYLADAHLLRAVNADFERRGDVARSEAAQAAQVGPRESVYSVEVGNVAFERGDWGAARLAYQEAARLGTYNPLVYRTLAMADRNLDLKSEAIAAARQAVELDRFDPANQDLLAELVAAGP